MSTIPPEMSVVPHHTSDHQVVRHHLNPDGIQGVFWVRCNIDCYPVYRYRQAQPVTPEQVLQERRDLQRDPELVKRVVAESKSPRCVVYLQVTTIQVTARGSTLNDSGDIKDPNKLEAPSTLNTADLDCCVPVGVWRCYPSDAVKNFKEYVDARNIIPLIADRPHSLIVARVRPLFTSAQPRAS